jgi:hypothetical protein
MAVNRGDYVDCGTGRKHTGVLRTAEVLPAVQVRSEAVIIHVAPGAQWYSGMSFGRLGNYYSNMLTHNLLMGAFLSR